MFAGQTSKREIWRTIGCFDFDMDAAGGVMVHGQSAAIIISAIFVMIVNTHDSKWALARKPPDLSVLSDPQYHRAASHASPLGLKDGLYQPLEYRPRSCHGPQNPGNAERNKVTRPHISRFLDLDASMRLGCCKV